MLYNISHKYFSNVKFDKDGFPISTGSQVYLEDDLIFDIKQDEKFKGLLIICPTPIGNLNDLSLRQHEAIKVADILACEDTRVTSKLLEQINKKKMKENFYMEFGITVDDFVNAGGLDMSDEQIEDNFLKNKFKGKSSKINDFNSDTDVNTNINDENRNNQRKTFESANETKENSFNSSTHTDININANASNSNTNNSNKDKINSDATNYYNFYFNKEEVYKKDHIANKVNKLEIKDQQVIINKQKQAKDLNELSNKDSIEEIESKIFSKFKVKEETYDYVKSKKDFEQKKKAILEENFEDDMEKLAEELHKNKNFSFILRNKAKYILNSSSSNFYKKAYQSANSENNASDENSNNKSDYDYLDLESGLEDNYFSEFKKRIKNEKMKKGRGILFPYRQENEERASKTLIRAMKLGLKVVLLSDAGTPTISDPGYRLVRACSKENIVVESIPGPCALITALSASGIATDKFMFIGYLSKSKGEKVRGLERLKESGVTGIIYESPLRTQDSLEVIERVYGENHEVYVGNELTKLHEAHHYGKVSKVLEKIRNLNDNEETHLRGEVTIVISPFIKKENDSDNIDIRNIKEGNIVNVDVYKAAEKLNSLIDLSVKDMKQLLIEMFDIPKARANKISHSVINGNKNVKDL